ncbi:DUF3226 domain-containing protein [Massilia endophytica]|uniref:DUF3226 domain-containing protein n=1 Tax=Massilia endophytica TaxID=2899220 RepID=UPI001E433B25|nr:DUF3226 domain-containing protein [Massilia endophytica]UGQ48877.1 hypothetical protein LSQ66_10560 [Massilia endophytica]
MSKKILIVEGETDKLFFATLLKKIRLSGVEIYPPRDMEGGGGNGVDNLKAALGVTLKRVPVGTYERIGVVLDADYPDQHGFHVRRNMLVQKFGEHGFSHSLSLAQVVGRGEMHEHSNFSAKCGFWVMPDHHNDGMAESLIIAAAEQGQKPLLAHAKKAVQGIKEPLFNKTHTDKAVLSTWLAWQKWAGMPLEKAVERDVVDVTADKFPQLCSWLQQMYS